MVTGRKNGGLLAGVLLAVLVLIAPFPPPAPGGWLALLWDWAHFPLFALLGWGLFRQPSPAAPGWSREVLARLLFLLVLALGVEAVQPFTGRTADWQDVLTGLLGAGMSLALVVADRQGKVKTSRPGVWAARAAALGALSGSLQPLLDHGLKVMEYRQQFPRLVKAGTVHAEPAPFWFLETDGRPVPPPPENGALSANLHARGLTSLQHLPPVPEWENYTALKLVYRLEATAPVRLGIRIDGTQAGSRVRLEALLQPEAGAGMGTDLSSGSNPYEVEVALPQTPEARAVLRSVQKLVLFTLDPEVAGHLVLEEVTLRP